MAKGSEPGCALLLCLLSPLPFLSPPSLSPLCPLFPWTIGGTNPEGGPCLHPAFPGVQDAESAKTFKWGFEKKKETFDLQQCWQSDNANAVDPQHRTPAWE